MSLEHPKFKAAAIQAAPVFMNLEATVEKSIGLIAEAARAGAQLVVFPETWFPGYPFWAWLGAPAYTMHFVQDYFDNSIEVDSPEWRQIEQAAAANNIHVAFGYSERSGGSLYMGQALISDTGETLFARRKLKPTHVERAIFGEGDGSDITVTETSLGRVGGLCCWEHLQPLTRYAMYSMNEQVHISAWPSFGLYAGMTNNLSPEVNLGASRNYAFEGQCFVIAATIIIDQPVIDRLVDTPDKAPLIQLGGGYSKIYGPDGGQLSEDLPHDQEGMVFGDIDLGMISLSKSAADPAGHYSRPDVLRLLFNAQPQRRVEYELNKTEIEDTAPIPFEQAAE